MVFRTPAARRAIEGNPPPVPQRTGRSCRPLVYAGPSVSLLAVCLFAPRPRPPAASDEEVSWPVAYTSVASNPADALAELAVEDSEYDPATRCSKKPKPGMTALVEWLGRNADGVSWGTYRCEKWGPRSARCTPRAAPWTGRWTSTSPRSGARPGG